MSPPNPPTGSGPQSGGKSTHEMLQSADFRQLVSRKWLVSIILTVALFVIYYGFILLIGYNKEYLAAPLSSGGATTRGIPIGVGVIIGAWILTFLYVIWANKSYDVEVKRLKDQVKH